MQSLLLAGLKIEQAPFVNKTVVSSDIKAEFMSPEGQARRDSAKEVVGALFTEWYGPMVRYACRATGSLDAAEDTVQASFTDLYRALLAGKAIANPKGWILCVVRRGIVDRTRESRRHGGPFLGLSDVANLPQLRVEPEVGHWANTDLSRYLSGLSAREEEVLLLRVQALKYRQIAAELKIGINSVKTLLARAIRKMQQATAANQGPRGSRRDDDIISAALQ
jgi:RNA polymerase sigma factor (sigma-70 family)